MTLANKAAISAVTIADNNLTDLGIGTFQPSLKLYTFPYRDPRLH
jgi:hypothetical protein